MGTLDMEELKISELKVGDCVGIVPAHAQEVSQWRVKKIVRILKASLDVDDGRGGTRRFRKKDGYEITQYSSTLHTAFLVTSKCAEDRNEKMEIKRAKYKLERECEELRWRALSAEQLKKIINIAHGEEPVKYCEVVDSDCGDLMSVKDFLSACEAGTIINSDGFGNAARCLMDGDTDVYPSKRKDIPKDCTHIVWYNK